MLKEFLKRQGSIPIRLGGGNGPEIVNTFFNQITFLSNPDTFPNQRVNNLTGYTVALAARGMLHWNIKRTLFGDDPAPLTFCSSSPPEERGDLIGAVPVMVFPSAYLSKVKNQPFQSLGEATALSSLIADYFHLGDKSGLVMRSFAYQAETYGTLKRLVELEGLKVDFGPKIEEILENLPNGLDDLPREFRYWPVPLLRPKTEMVSLSSYQDTADPYEETVYLN